MSELWLKLAVNFPRHPKVAKAGPAAAWLAVCAMAYCREHLTDGMITAAVVPTLAAVKKPLVLADKLVQVGLWHKTEDGFKINDFLKWNPSRAEVESNREKWKDKKKNQRSVPEGHTEGHSRESHESPYVRADAPAPDARSASVSSLPVVGFPEGSLRETERQERQKYGPPLVGSPIAHRGHGWCNQRGLCLTANFYAELLGKLGRHREPEFRAWLGSVIDALGDEPVGDDVFDFWRNHFAAWVGTVTMKPSTQKETAGVRLARVGAEYLKGEGIGVQPARPLASSRPQRQIAGGE